MNLLTQQQSPEDNIKANSWNIMYMKHIDHITALVVKCWYPTVVAWVQNRSGHVGFVVDKVTLKQVFTAYFSFPFQFSFNQLLHIH
jgi:hypothetical protein